MQTWLVADWHLGEDRFEIMDRPFKQVDEMINTLIIHHNSVVGKDDLVYVIGDVCYQKAPEYLPLVTKFNGKKVLIRGNHDRGIPDSEFKKYFKNVIAEGSGLELTIGDIPCYLTHYPTRGRKDRFNIVGHIHGVFKVQLNMLNVGVDAHHFRPVNANKVPFYFKAVQEFYDEDAWVAYNPINQDYVGKRGKKGSYLP